MVAGRVFRYDTRVTDLPAKADLSDPQAREDFDARDAQLEQYLAQPINSARIASQAVEFRHLSEQNRYAVRPWFYNTIERDLHTAEYPPADGQLCYVYDVDTEYAFNGVWEIARVPVRGNPRTYNPLLTATITNPALGSTGILKGRYSINAGWAAVTVYCSFGGTGISSGNGSFFVSLPPAAPALAIDGFEPLGGGYVYRAATNQVYVTEQVANNLDGTKCGMAYSNTLAGGVDNLGPGRPGSWNAGDQIRLHLHYPIA